MNLRGRVVRFESRPEYARDVQPSARVSVEMICRDFAGELPRAGEAYVFHDGSCERGWLGQLERERDEWRRRAEGAERIAEELRQRLTAALNRPPLPLPGSYGPVQLRVELPTRPALAGAVAAVQQLGETMRRFAGGPSLDQNLRAREAREAAGAPPRAADRAPVGGGFDHLEETARKYEPPRPPRIERD